ncbi:hypothetical protein BMG05_02990 [Mycobacterium malmoense]|nr:hypothetical protein BMG05_02990 [Mycobacterium malmoense]
MVVDLAARPHITAAATLAAASIITVAPITQHLPNFYLGQQLSQVSLSEIQLTDATSGMMDLFSGVENELVSISHGAAAGAVPASVVDEFGSWLPAQTWINALTTANSNIQSLYQLFEAHPFPLLQQVAANFLQYGYLYVHDYHLAANAASNYFLGGDFISLLQGAWSGYLSGNFAVLNSSLFDAFYLFPLEEIGEPLEPILRLPSFMLQNATNIANYLAVTGVPDFVAQGGLAVPGNTSNAIGAGIQAIANSWATGDPSGLATNILNMPGLVANEFLNGNITALGYSGGLISNHISIGKYLTSQIPQQIAADIVAPNAQNIMSGGSLQVAAQTFWTTLTQGWPPFGNYLAGVPGQLTSLLQSIPSIVSNLPEALSGFATALGGVAGQLGTLLINLLKLL